MQLPCKCHSSRNIVQQTLPQNLTCYTQDLFALLFMVVPPYYASFTSAGKRCL